MSVLKDFPGLENLEKIQGLSRTRKSPASNAQTQPTNQMTQFWSRASVQLVSGTSFLSVCHLL